jgi:hypothetical protein
MNGLKTVIFKERKIKNLQLNKNIFGLILLLVIISVRDGSGSPRKAFAYWRANEEATLGATAVAATKQKTEGLKRTARPQAPLKDNSVARLGTRHVIYHSTFQSMVPAR